MSFVMRVACLLSFGLLLFSLQTAKVNVQANVTSQCNVFFQYFEVFVIHCNVICSLKTPVQKKSPRVETCCPLKKLNIWAEETVNCECWGMVFDCNVMILYI
jgi:hypothetical protein